MRSFATARRALERWGETPSSPDLPATENQGSTLHTNQVARALNAVAQIKPAVGVGGIAPVHGTDLRKPSLPLLRKIPVIPFQQCLGIVRYQVTLPVKLLGLARLQSAHAWIVVQADNYALKQFLSLVPGHGQQIITVCRKT